MIVVKSEERKEPSKFSHGKKKKSNLNLISVVVSCLSLQFPSSFREDLIIGISAHFGSLLEKPFENKPLLPGCFIDYRKKYNDQNLKMMTHTQT